MTQKYTSFFELPDDFKYVYTIERYPNDSRILMAHSRFKTVQEGWIMTDCDMLSQFDNTISWRGYQKMLVDIFAKQLMEISEELQKGKL